MSERYPKRTLATTAAAFMIAAGVAGEAKSGADKTGGGAKIEQVEKFPPFVITAEKALDQMNKDPKVLNIIMTMPITQEGYGPLSNEYFYCAPDETAPRHTLSEYDPKVLDEGRTHYMGAFPRPYTDKKGKDWIMFIDYMDTPSKYKDPFPAKPVHGMSGAALWLPVSAFPKGAVIYEAKGTQFSSSQHTLRGQIKWLTHPGDERSAWYLTVPGISDYGSIAFMDTAPEGQEQILGLKPLKDQNLEHYIHSGK